MNEVKSEFLTPLDTAFHDGLKEIDGKFLLRAVNMSTWQPEPHSLVRNTTLKAEFGQWLREMAVTYDSSFHPSGAMQPAQPAKVNGLKYTKYL